MPAVSEARKPKPRRLDQGSNRTVHDRGGRTRRAHRSRLDAGRGNGRQHRPGPGLGRRAKGVPAYLGHSRQDEPGKGVAPEGVGRGSRDDPQRRGPRPSSVLSRHGRGDRQAHAECLLCQSVQQSRKSARPRDHDRAGNLGSDESQRGRRRLRRRLRRHDHGVEPFLRSGGPAGRDGAGRSGRLGVGRLRSDGTHRPGRLLGGRRDWRGFRAADRRLVAGAKRLHDRRRRKSRHRPQPAEK